MVSPMPDNTGFLTSTTDVNSAARAWRIAVHEAGHCVAVRLLDLPGCGEASVEPNAYARFPCNDGDRSIVALMAGAAAEVALFGDYDRTGARTDAGRVGARLAFGFGDSSALWHYTVDFIIRPHIGLISFVAFQLARERVLDGAAIDSIVSACLIEGWVRRAERF
jgi:hypothetical protein